MKMAVMTKGRLRARTRRLIRRFRPTRLFGLLGARGILKMAEVKLLGRYASTYCYNPPDTVFLELTNHCQLKCEYCYRENADLMNPDQGLMSYEKFTKVVDQLRGVRRLYLCWGGEVTLHKDLVRMLQYVKDQRIAKRFGIVSNGMLLRPALADRILASGISFIAISLDGSDAETHESIRLGSDFATIVENMHYLATHAKPGTEISANGVVTTRNLESMAALPVLLKKIGVRRLMAQSMLDHTEATQGLRIEDPAELISALEETCRVNGIQFTYAAMPAKVICADPFRSFGITWDGKLTPCCNIQNEGLRDDAFVATGRFWNSPEMRAWRERILRRDYPGICHGHCEIAPGAVRNHARRDVSFVQLNTPSSALE